MIPVKMFPEPVDFDAKVRRKGLGFLALTPSPTQGQWHRKSFWREIIPEMRILYGGICNFCGVWIPYHTGSQSIDHFLNKNVNPNLAYEWTNFRYVSSRFNSRKQVSEIIDPFTVTNQDFLIRPDNFKVYPGKKLSILREALVDTTITKILNLNSRELIAERFSFYQKYLRYNREILYLEEIAPFLAREVKKWEGR